jgi:hypothetical protein
MVDIVICPLGFKGFFLHTFRFIHFHFILLLREGRAGEAWEPSTPPSSGVTSTSHYTPHVSIFSL